VPIPLLTPTRPRRARRLAAGALVALAVPLAGCGSGGGGGGNSDVDPASVVPASAAFYGEVTVRPEGDLKASVETLAKKIAQNDDPGGELVKQIDAGLKDQNLTFKDDIDPWLGKKAAVAITGLKDPQHPDYAIVIAATDTGKALDALKKDEKGLVERTYKDVKYTFNAKQQQAAAGVGDTLVVATEASLKSIIDVDKGGASLAKSDKLAKARKGVTSDGLGFFYVDPVSVIDLLASSSPALGSQAGPLKSLLGGDKASAIGAALTAAADSIRLETAVDGQAAATAADEAAATTAGLPAGSVAAAGFGSIASRAEKGVAQLQQLGGIYATVLAQFKTITGLDLEQDVLSWMGKGGLFVRAKGLADIGGALVVDTSDAKKSAAFIDSARGLISQFGASSGLRVSSFSGQGAKGFQLKAAQFPFPIIVATGAGKFVIAVGDSSVREALKPTTTLGDDPRFKATATQLGAKPALYVDLQAIIGFANLAAGSDPGYQKAKKYLQAFTALAAGSEHSGGTTKSRVVVGVK
jgi:hypothetical protein